MTRARILTLVGYNAYFVLAFLLFCYWTFPYDRLAAYLIDRVAESGSGYTLDIGSLEPYWLTGVELEQVKVRKQAAAMAAPATAAPGDKKAAPAPEPGITVSTAHARLGLFSLLFGSKKLSFGAELGQGEIEGTFEQDGDDAHVVATLSKVDLGKLGLLESLVSVPMQGTLTGDFDLALAKAAAKTNGKVKLTIQKMVVGDGKAKLKVGAMGGLTLDPISAGDVTLEMDVKEGVGTVRKMSANGSDLRLQGSGEVRFTQPLKRSRLGLLLRLELTDAYRNKSSRTKAMFMLLDSSPAPQVAAAKTADGAFQLRLTGPLSSVRALPAGMDPSGGAGGAGGLPAMPDVAAGGDDDE